MAGTANRVIKNTGFLYAKMGVTMFISLYTTRLILNSLGVSDFGIFNIVGGAIAMLGFLNAAMAGVTQRFMSYYEGGGDKERQKSIFNISLILHFIIASTVGITLTIAGIFFFNGILNIPPDRIMAAKVVYGSLIISTIITVLTVPYDATMNAHENMKYYAIVGVIESLLKLLVAVIVVHTSSDKLIVYGILMACIPIISLTIMRIYCHRNYEECVTAPKRYWDKSLMKEMTGFAGWNFSNSSTSMVGNYGLGIVLNMFFGTALNTAQGIAGQLNGQLCVFASTMLKALNPVIAKSEGANKQQIMQQATLIGSKFTFFLTAFFAVPAFLEMPFLLKIWLKNVPDYTVIFTQLQITRTLIEQLTITLGIAITAHGDIRNFSIYNTLLNLLPLPLIYLAFSLGAPPTFLYIVSILIWSFGGNALKLAYAKKKCNISIQSYIHEVLIPCLWVISPTFLGGLCLTFCLQTGWLRLILTASLCSIIFLISFWIKGTNSTERRKIFDIYQKIKLKYK